MYVHFIVTDAIVFVFISELCHFLRLYQPERLFSEASARAAVLTLQLSSLMSVKLEVFMFLLSYKEVHFVQFAFISVADKLSHCA